MASQPPMFASPSFLALMVIPSASEAISRTMSGIGRPAWPGSRSWMNQAFSANRQASRKSGTPNRSQIARTPRRFSRQTGWPPPLLLVIVTNTTGTSGRAALLEERLERDQVHVALERVLQRWLAALGDDQVDRLRRR